MFETISKGRPNTQMGAFSNVYSSEAIWMIIAYLREEAARVKASARQTNDEDDLWQ